VIAMMAAMTREEKLLIVWMKYRDYKLHAEVIRAGFWAWGVYGAEQADRGESDLEHIGGVRILLFLMAQFFPEVVGEDCLLDLLLLADFHELGELVLGDLMDDGTYDVDEKLSLERAVAVKWFDGLPNNSKYIDLYDGFANLSSVSGRLVRLADKVEAVLQGLIYEAEGRGGSLSMKRYPSTRDQVYAARMGSDSLVDIWGLNYFEDVAVIDETGLFADLLRVAIRHVRGVDFVYPTI
jgi:5'-deoxynucleotidase YfbR-like HD superfamily hydrolase